MFITIVFWNIIFHNTIIKKKWAKWVDFIFITLFKYKVYDKKID